MSDEELIEFATDFREGILGGGPSDLMCAAVCWPLEGLLRVSGVHCASRETKSVGTEYGECNHIWIELADGRALDPTADQFGSAYPPVYLGRPLSIHAPTPANIPAVLKDRDCE